MGRGFAPAHATPSFSRKNQIRHFYCDYPALTPFEFDG